MILTRVVPEADEPIDLESPDFRERLVELYGPGGSDWVRLNLIGSVSGSATGPDGTSETLTNPVDRAILGVIRSQADVVLVGAASIRAEGYFIPRNGALAVVSRTGNFADHQLRGTTARGRLIILCPSAAVETAQQTIGMPDVTVIAVPDADGSLSAPDIVSALRGAGFRSIVVEGGPEIATLFVIDDAVDELCLTTSPVLNGGAMPLFGSREFDGHPLTLTQLLVDSGGATYARWRMRGSG
ncbi:MAG TPA: dihydrofolate reductase family protein [Galbitalea sp.]